MNKWVENKRLCLLVLSGLAFCLPVAVQAQELELTEEEKKILEENGQGNLVKAWQSAKAKRQEALKSRQLTLDNEDAVRVKQNMGFWWPEELQRGVTRVNIDPMANPEGFENIAATNIKLYYRREGHVAYCFGTPHAVDAAALEAVQPIVEKAGPVTRVRVYYRVRYGSTQGNGSGCSGQSASLSQEWVQTLDGSWFVPDWSLYIIMKK